MKIMNRTRAGLACLTALSVVTAQAGPPETPLRDQPQLIQVEPAKPPGLVSTDKAIAELATLTPKIKRALNELDKQAKPLKESRDRFKADPSDANTTKLLACMAGLVTNGVFTCLSVAELAQRGAELQIDLASAVETNLTRLRTVLSDRDVAASANTDARGLAMAKLERINADLAATEVSEDRQLTPEKRTRLSTTLRALRETDLANKIGTWTVGELDRAIKSLEKAKAAFLEEALTLKDISEDYGSYARSFVDLGAAINDVSLAGSAVIGVEEAFNHNRELRAALDNGKVLVNGLFYGAPISTGDGTVIQPSASTDSLIERAKKAGSKVQLPSFAK